MSNYFNIEEAYPDFKLFTRLLIEMIQSVNNVKENPYSKKKYVTKILKKIVNHAVSIDDLNYVNQLRLKQNSHENKFDFSAVFILVRSIFETYATTYHFYFDKCPEDEKILRFRLWELDGLQGKLDFKSINDPTIKAELKENQKYFDQIKLEIESNPCFIRLSEKSKKKLIKGKRYNWKFTTDTNNEVKFHSYDSLIEKTQINKSLKQDIYSFFSMHTHAQYHGITQISTLTHEQIEITKIVAFNFVTFIASFVLIELPSIWKAAEEYLKTLQESDLKKINKYYIDGKTMANNI